MATRQHHRVLISGLINYQRSHDLILKRVSIKDNKKLYDPKIHSNIISTFEDILVFVVINIIFEPY